jgi:tripeptidyl-peptidase I
MFGKPPHQFLLFSFVAFSYTSYTSASPATSSGAFTKMIVQDSRDEVPYGFVSSGPVPLDKIFNLRIAMASNNMAGLEERLYAVSDPGSADYGKHLSKEEVSSFISVLYVKMPTLLPSRWRHT